MYLLFVLTVLFLFLIFLILVGRVILDFLCLLQWGFENYIPFDFILCRRKAHNRKSNLLLSLFLASNFYYNNQFMYGKLQKCMSRFFENVHISNKTVVISTLFVNRKMMVKTIQFQSRTPTQKKLFFKMSWFQLLSSKW